MGKYPHPVFGWNAGKLADLSFEQLNELRLLIERDPENANPARARGQSIYIYTKPARKKLDALSWAVAIKLNAAKHEVAA